MSKERFCPYGRHFVPDEGFKIVYHPASNTQRGMCPACQAKRKLPRAALQELADQERAARSAKAQEAAAAARERKSNANPRGQ